MLLSQYSKKLNYLFNKHGFTLSIAESCTGGLLSSMITRYSGASSFLDSAVVVYSNQAKIDLLKIPQDILTEYGAVSEEVAILLAQNIKNIRKTNFSVAITGIAGPKSDITNKAVGLVYIALKSDTISIVRKYNFSGSRKKIQRSSCKEALKLLINHLSVP